MAALTSSVSGQGRAISADQFVALNDELRAMVRAGIPLDLGLRGTAARTEGRLKRLAQRLARHIAAGRSLDEAIAAERVRVPPQYRAILSVGLRTGRLPEVLGTLSELTESMRTLRRELRISLIYPACVIVLAYVLLAGFVWWVVPQLERTYTVFQLSDSWWTETLSWLRETLDVWFWGVPAALAGGILLIWIGQRVIGSGSGDVVSAWVPGLRSARRARFAGLLALLVEQAVPLPEALRLSGAACGDARLRAASARVADRIEAGHPLTDILQGERGMPSLLRWLMGVGERQSALAPSLKQAAAVYEQRARMRMEWFRRVVPPLVVLVLGGAITLMYGLTLFLPLTEVLRGLTQP